MDDVKEKVREIIMREYLAGEDPSQLKDDTPIITGGILDSLSTLRFIGLLEEEFGIKLDAQDADYDNLNTVKVIASLVETKRAQKCC
jgi:acyl carrier protein